MLILSRKWVLGSLSAILYKQGVLVKLNSPLFWQWSLNKVFGRMDLNSDGTSMFRIKFVVLFK